MAAYTQCLRCAGAPRRPAGGSGLSLPFLLGMPLSMTPGSSIIASPELRCRHGLRRDLSSSALPILPQSVSRGARISGLPDSRNLLRPAKLLAPLYGSDRCTRPPRAFTSRLPTDRSPSPLLDMTTTASGLLCWRDSHPLEWQLASLHQNRTGPIRAYGSHLGCVTAKRFSLRFAVCAPARVTRLPGSESGACFAGSHSPWPPPLAPPTPLRSGPLCSSASQLLWQSLTSRDRASSATAPRLPDADRRRLPNGRSRDLPVPAQRASAHARFFDHAGSTRRSRYCVCSCCLPRSKQRRHPGIGFRGSMAGLCPPLPTLRRRPRGRQRTARGRCGSLLLHRSGLAPPTPCRSPGALRVRRDRADCGPLAGLREKLCVEGASYLG